MKERLDIISTTVIMCMFCNNLSCFQLYSNKTVVKEIVSMMHIFVIHNAVNQTISHYKMTNNFGKYKDHGGLSINGHLRGQKVFNHEPKVSDQMFSAPSNLYYDSAIHFLPNLKIKPLLYHPTEQFPL